MILPAAVVLSWVLLAQESADPPRTGLARHRGALQILEARNTDGTFVVADDEVARIAEEIERAIDLPPTWRVVLRPDDPNASVEDPIHTRILPTIDAVETVLSDRSGRKLALKLTFDAQWVLLGHAAFIGPDGATEFTRAQFRSRANFFPLRSLAVVLERLESELDAFPLEESKVRYLGLESAQPLGESSSVRCVLGLEDDDQLTTTELNGVIPLPTTAAHEKGFTFAGNQGFGDSVIGPVTSTRTLGRAIREARAMRDAIGSGGPWFAHVFHNSGSDAFSTYVSDARIRRPDEQRATFRIDSEGFVGATDEISAGVAGVRLTSEGLSELLKLMAASHDASKQSVFAVLGCADRHEIVVLFTSLSLVPPSEPIVFGSAGVVPPGPNDVTSLRLAFDAAGSRVDRVERIPVRDVQRASEDWHTRWTLRFGDDRVVDVGVHDRVLCGNGMDLTSRARIGDTDYRVAGGLVEGALRGGW